MGVLKNYDLKLFNLAPASRLPPSNPVDLLLRPSDFRRFHRCTSAPTHVNSRRRPSSSRRRLFPATTLQPPTPISEVMISSPSDFFCTCCDFRFMLLNFCSIYASITAISARFMFIFIPKERQGGQKVLFQTLKQVEGGVIFLLIKCKHRSFFVVYLFLIYRALYNHRS